MRGALLGSGLVHVAIVAALFVVRASAPVIVPGPDVVQVSLTDLASLQAPARPAPEPARPSLKAAELKPTDEEGVKLAPPKQPPAKPEKPREQEPAPEPAPQLPYAQIGNSGLAGQVAVDARDFEFTYYLMLVRNKVAQAWAAPAGLPGGRRVRAAVYFRIGRDGGLSSIRLEEASGIEFFDRSALRAVTLSDPLPPLPLGYPGGALGVHFGFQYAQP
ncbi:MAG: TonB family protein [Candidatus Eisenbacteria bacterium]|nr:TonB family protein [Candidatus Eisenbacteria bacterium]